MHFIYSQRHSASQSSSTSASDCSRKKLKTIKVTSLINQLDRQLLSIESIHDLKKRRNSEFYHLTLVVQKPLDVRQHFPHELLLFTHSHMLHHLLQNTQQPQLHQIPIEILIRKHIEYRIDGLSPPLLQLQLRNVQNQVF